MSVVIATKKDDKNQSRLARLPGSADASLQTLTPGQRIAISGTGPRGAHAGEWIALESDAFLSNIETNGIPTIRTQVLLDGTYQASATIKPGVKPDTYAIMRFHNGQPLDTTTWVTVRPYSSVAARPPLASPGQPVAISGNAPRNAHAGDWVTLKSHAFSSRFTTDGIPSIRAQVLEDGTYSVTTTLLSSLAPATYTVLGTYHRQPLDTIAHISIS
jgi:hypothetical protein